MPIKKEPCLREMLQQRYRDKILGLFDEWLSLLISVEHPHMWKYTPEDIPEKCDQLNELLSELAPTVRFNIISEILPKVFRKLVRFKFNSAKNQMSCKDLSQICQSILGTILFPCIKELYLESCDTFTINVAINCLHKVPKLTTLKILLPIQLPINPLPMALEDKISHLPELKKLINPKACTNLTLRNLSVYCTGLTFLDIHASTQLDNTCVDYIILLKNLEFLNISQCSISAISYQNILKKLPKLKNISWYLPIDGVIADLPAEYGERILNADIRTSQIRILIEKLHNLNELSISGSWRNVNFSYLVELTHLNVLKVTYFNFVLSCMNTFFEQSGHNLKILELNIIKNFNLSVILRNCSNLKYLSLYICDISHDIVVRKKEMTSHFLNLEILKLDSVIYRGYFHSFVYLYRNLKIFHAEHTTKIDDEFVNVTLEFEGFKNLERFVARCCPVSTIAAHALINSCHNLKLLGDLKYWHNSPDVVTQIKNRIWHENMALKLIIDTEEWSS